MVLWRERESVRASAFACTDTIRITSISHGDVTTAIIFCRSHPAPILMLYGGDSYITTILIIILLYYSIPLPRAGVDDSIYSALIVIQYQHDVKQFNNDLYIYICVHTANASPPANTTTQFKIRSRSDIFIEYG